MPGGEEVIGVLDRLDSPEIGVLVNSSRWRIIGYAIDAFFSDPGERL
jgi:hypothetical protein